MMILYVSMQNDFDRLTVGEIYGEFSWSDYFKEVQGMPDMAEDTWEYYFGVCFVWFWMLKFESFLRFEIGLVEVFVKVFHWLGEAIVQEAWCETISYWIGSTG